MSKKLNAKYLELTSSRKGISRYAELTYRTIKEISTRKPTIVFCQNPSIVLSLICVIVRPIFDYRLIVDEHNAGLFPLEGRSSTLNVVAKYIIRKADRVIVTNDKLKTIATEWGGVAFIIPDPLPNFSETLRLPVQWTTRSLTNLLFICTWSDDEPYQTVVEASAKLQNNPVTIKITGNHRDKLKKNQLPENVTLTGFLSEEDYLKELSLCDGVIVLTDREDCLNCGAYEAVAMEKPGILSDTKALKTYFHRGFLFASPRDQTSIANAITSFLQKKAHLDIEIVELRKELSENSNATKHLEEYLRQAEESQRQVRPSKFY